MTDTTSKLCDEMAAYCLANGLEHHSADEMACDIGEQIHNLREVQAITNRNLARLESINAYLHSFIARWDAAQDRETLANTLQRAGFSLHMAGGGVMVWERHGESLYAVITGPEGDRLDDSHSPATVGIYANDGDGESIVETECADVRQAIRIAEQLVR